MNIDKLKIENLRVFDKVTINPSKSINIIYGSNGSGKTTLLESIYILARSKSFRTNNTQSLIKRGKSELLLYANILDKDGINRSIGIRKSTEISEVRISGVLRNRVSDQIKALPLGIITSTIQKLLTEGPSHRRRFINWVMFHVEPDYPTLYYKYKRCLQQRNIELRRRSRDIQIWDQQLSFYGEKLSNIISDYIRSVESDFIALVGESLSLKSFVIEYKQGWSKEFELKYALNRNYLSGLTYTNVGPHIGDLLFTINGRPVKDFLSSGQLKTLTILFVLYQISYIKNQIKSSPVLLIDDICSELDFDNLNIVFNHLKRLDVQIFMTSIKNVNIDIGTVGKVFHVEHGSVNEASV